MCACKETDVRESPNNSTLTDGEGTVVEEKHYTQSTVKVPFPPCLNTLYIPYKNIKISSSVMHFDGVVNILLIIQESKSSSINSSI
jgi:hypothetical protein